MTGQLETTLRSRAEGLDICDADVEAIVRTGDRRVRRRRRTAVVGGVAGVLAIAGVVTLAGRGHTLHRPPPAGETTIPLSYALGSVIHSGSSQVDVGVRVASFVRTTRGFVFSDRHRRVYEEKDGNVHQIGRLPSTSTRLVAGEDGLEVGWWAGDRAMVYPGWILNGWPNSFTNSQKEDAAVQPGHPASVRATSGGFMWFTNGYMTRGVDIRREPSDFVSWREHEFDGHPGMLQDVAGDQMLIRVRHGLAVTRINLPPRDGYAEARWKTGTDISGVEPQVMNVRTGNLAPDARHWFTADDGGLRVYDSTTGDEQELAGAGFVGVAPYQWLDSDTVAALGRRSSDPSGRVSLLICRVSTNECTVAIADVGRANRVVVSDGRPADAR